MYYLQTYQGRVHLTTISLKWSFHEKIKTSRDGITFYYLIIFKTYVVYSYIFMQKINGKNCILSVLNCAFSWILKFSTKCDIVCTKYAYNMQNIFQFHRTTSFIYRLFFILSIYMPSNKKKCPTLEDLFHWENSPLF